MNKRKCNIYGCTEDEVEFTHSDIRCDDCIDSEARKFEL